MLNLDMSNKDITNHAGVCASMESLYTYTGVFGVVLLLAEILFWCFIGSKLLKFLRKKQNN
jgi:hypothetical protein